MARAIQTLGQKKKQPRPYGIEVQLVGLILDLVQLIAQLVVVWHALFLSTFVSRKKCFYLGEGPKKK